MTRPPRIEPMLATPWKQAFDDPQWVFEPKWDGVRGVVTVDGDVVTITSRRGNEVAARYPELTALRHERPLVLDGEVVAFDADGAPSFERLQGRMNRSAPGETLQMTPVQFVVFDVLWDGDDLRGWPLEDRRTRLETLPLDPPYVLTPSVAEHGTDLWVAVVERGIEGVVAKRLGSTYRSGVRSADWRKIANVIQTRAVVGGFTPGDGNRSGGFGALLLGLFDGPKLRWIGAVGTGFSHADVAAIRSALDEIRRDESPFFDDPLLPRDAVFVEPDLVAAIGFRDWTSAGRLRHPRFLGFLAEAADEITWQAEGPGTYPGR